MRSTPIDKMQKITGIPPLKRKFQSKALTLYTKAEALKDHQSHNRTKQRGRGRLGRESFIGQAKALKEKFKEDLPIDIEAIQIADDWKEAPVQHKIQTAVQHLGPNEVTSKEQRWFGMIEDSYPDEAWTHIYTDGSASDAVKNGGAGVKIANSDRSRVPNPHWLVLGKSRVQ